MNPFAIITDLRVQDVLDILFLTMVVYHFYLWFWGTKAFKALVGLMVLGIVFTAARSWGLFLTTWAFQILWQVLVILLIILFQSEIRQVLEKVNPLKALGLHSFYRTENWVDNFVKALFSLARRKIGALIIIERSDIVEELITEGVPLEGEPNKEVLLSIFQKKSPLHDGAVLIRNGNVTRVACYLPLSSREGLPKNWGTRHRAAVGLSERCDACVLVISEERGGISLVRDGEAKDVSTKEQLSDLISSELIDPELTGMTLWKKLQTIMVRRWRMKLGTFGLVSIFWLLLAGQQNYEVTLDVSVELKNVPAMIEVIEPLSPKVEVTLRGLRKDAGTLSSKNVQAQVDVSTAGPGVQAFRVTRNHIVLTNERIQVVRISPTRLEFKFGYVSATGTVPARNTPMHAQEQNPG